MKGYLSATIRFSVLILLCAMFTQSASGQKVDYTRWVNPFIGTGGHGHTFPGATVPFGMVQLSPDTRIDNWDGSSGYHYSDDIIHGFSHTHLSGTGIPDGCDILLMPASLNHIGGANDKDDPVLNGYASKFRHDNERAEPGYYSVMLDDDSILAEMTATRRVGLHRYTFPKTGSYRIVLDLMWRDKVSDSQLRFSGTNRIEGFRKSSSWSKNQTVYFVAEFSKPIRNFTMGLPPSGDGSTWRGKNLFTDVHFETKARDQILVKVAISYVSIEGARKNLEAEIPGWDFDKVRADAKAAWNKELSKIEVAGGTPDQMTNFYTALYHTAIQPNVFSDVDGRYLGHDRKIHQLRSADTPLRIAGSSGETSRKAKNLQASRTLSRRSDAHADKSVRVPSEQYTVFSLWDTFRAAHPLYTITDQKRTADFINTFIRIYEQGGRLPVWELWGEETDTMIGYHAVPVIADAMAKGIKGFDYEKAYAAAKHSAELNHFGLAAYKKRGYISSEDENESVSKTLEYAYDDWCIAQMAKVLLLKESKPQKNGPIAQLDPSTGIASFPIDVEKQRYQNDFLHYLKRARYFENLFDPETGFMRPKRNGGFLSPFAPNEVTFNYTEGNAWVYTFFVPQDVSGLMTLMGGRENFAAKLDELFTTKDKLTGRVQPDITGLIGQYAHGNEPSHHIAYLFDYAHEPWKTQKYVRQILDEFYKPTPDGLIGNEDCGQMSAWYILSASGFYPVTPGSNIYAIGTPLFPTVKYHLENGRTFTIRAGNVSAKNFYILNARLNGAVFKKAFITYDDIRKGGKLEFSMTDAPVTTAFNTFPVSSIDPGSVPVPSIEAAEKTFKDKLTISIRDADRDARLFYKVFDLPAGFTRSTSAMDLSREFHMPDGDEYKGAFTITGPARVVAYAIDAKGRNSKPEEAFFYPRPNDWSVKILSPYSSQYTGGGDDAIIDGLRGNANFASGEWQGYQGKTFEAVIDLKRETTIREVGGSFLQAAGSWIWMPDRLEFEFSNDGEHFVKLVDFKPGFPQDEMKSTVREFTRAIKPLTARYVRVRAFNIGQIPAWHPGAGGDPWIFVDEIIIR